MSIDLNRLYEIINATTYQTRKGEPVAVKVHGDITVTDVMTMPTTAELLKEKPDAVIVDVHFMNIGIYMPEAERRKADLIAILRQFPSARELFARGPSYITLGGFVGDQGAALSMMALGEALGLWKVITPASLGMEAGPNADAAAGGGYVMTSPVQGGWLS